MLLQKKTLTVYRIKWIIGKSLTDNHEWFEKPLYFKATFDKVFMKFLFLKVSFTMSQWWFYTEQL